VGSLVTVFGVLLFFFILYDIFFPLGFFIETSSFFIVVPYAKIILLNIPFFSKFFENTIYIFPKYRLGNNFLNYSWVYNDFTVIYSKFLYKQNL